MLYIYTYTLYIHTLIYSDIALLASSPSCSEPHRSRVPCKAFAVVSGAVPADGGSMCAGNIFGVPYE